MKRKTSDNDVRAQLVREAWLGDAVLTLYAREKILRDNCGILDGEMAVRMTSNQFLGTIGEPTKVEAEVGRIYLSQGLPAAFKWVEDCIAPVFEKQERKRLRKSGVSPALLK